MRSIIRALGLSLLFVLPAFAQTQETKFIADTIVVQAEGKYEADPDLATLTFSISTQDKELKTAYAKASQSIQRILQIAAKNGLTKDEISTSALMVIPYYEGDRGKRRARSYRVESTGTLRVKDFSRIGALLDDSMQEGIVDLRSLTYSLTDEEAAKGRAVADAMRPAVGRASSAVEQKGQKLGALRYASLDVRQMTGYAIRSMHVLDLSPSVAAFRKEKAPEAPPAAESQPEKITVTAVVQCIFQIQ